MSSYFRDLGERIERSWLARSYDEELFPRLAAQALEENPPFGRIRSEDIVNLVFAPCQDSLQPGSARFFGEPPVTLYQAPRFFIEALFWFSGTTDIHAHAFSGAFAVLEGSSLHSHWAFNPTRMINSRLLCGLLERVSTEILRPGDVRLIHSGNRLIHQLFHLEMPSVTLVVRTYEEQRCLPQYKYLQPGLAIDAEQPDGLRARRLMFLDQMASGHLPGLREYAGIVIESGDLEAIFYMFSALSRRKVEENLLNDLHLQARNRYGATIDLFGEACKGEIRTRTIRLLRSKISDSGVRFFLALLMLMPDRDSILEVIRLQLPDIDPVTAIESWLTTASGKERIGFEFDEVNRLIVRGLLDGCDAVEMLERLREDFCDESIAEHRDKLISHARKLAKSELFTPLFSRSPLQREAHRPTEAQGAGGVLP